ncbi:MAG TPA: VTT domain-containing protein [Terriglobales bacterium]|nr:VTT domain-containing protein [Terriglobales bacterium]
MNDFFALVVKHGHIAVAAVVFAEAVGFPMPAAVALVAGGAAAASGVLSVTELFLLSVVAMLIGDVLLFMVGRYTGWTLLGFLCRVSMNPETCILRSAESFYKRGKMTLIFAKFIPGINTMAPPLAGTMKMRAAQFLRLDLLGAALYAAAYIGVGFIFHEFLTTILHGFQAAGKAVETIFVVTLVVYLIYRVWIYRKHAMYRIVPRIQVQELAQKLAAEEHDKILLVDVRSHGYYDAGAFRIKGSVRMEPNNLVQELKSLPHEKDIYLYCT